MVAPFDLAPEADNVFNVRGVGEHVHGLDGFDGVPAFNERGQVAHLGFRIAGNGAMLSGGQTEKHKPV